MRKIFTRPYKHIILLKISVLIPYREREIATVRRCLDALEQQSYQDFEIIFLDYGSNDAVQSQVEAICKEYKKVKYFYSETQGHFWSCSQAFNQAFYYASGEWFVMLDVDLIVPQDFLQKALSKITPDSFLVFGFLHLPRRFEDWQSLKNNTHNYLDLTISGNEAVGNIFVAKKYLSLVQGYDTFYRIWGEEDLDVMRKLQFIGLKAKTTQPKDLPIFHQWHPHSKHLLPKGWQEAIINHSKNKVLMTEPPSDYSFEGYPIISLDERPALQRYQHKQWTESEQFNFVFPLERSYAQFMKRFLQLDKGEAIYVSQIFSEVVPQKGSRLANLIKFGNRVFERIKVSYRWVEIDKAETELIYASTIANFLFYFVLEMEASIRDYYFEAKGEKISFVVVKK